MKSLSPILLLGLLLTLFFPQNAIAGEDKTVLLAILARNKAHVLPRFFDCIEALDYNKKAISVYINTNNNDDNTEELLKDWIAKNKNKYKEILIETHNVKNLPSTLPHEWSATRFKVLGKIRNDSMQKAKECGTDYYFVVDCDNFITPCTLKELVAQNKPMIAPLLLPIPEVGDVCSNYFCDINENGYYADHPAYLSIFDRRLLGTFKLPVVHCTYLIRTDCIDKLSYIDGTDDYEFIILSRMARKNNVDQYLCNEKPFGVFAHFFNEVSIEEEDRRLKEYFSK
jgi:hypothetical protein